MSHLKQTKNTLLVRDQQGKVKQSTYNLPEAKHAYGKKIVDDPEPIKRVVNGWASSTNSQDQPPTNKNYKELNKLSLKQGAITAKQQQQFRKTNNLMVQNKVGQKVMPIMLPEDQFVYGVPNRPSTPVKLIVGNCYGLEKEEQKMDQYMRETMKKQAQKGKKLHAGKTKAQVLREQTTMVEKNYRQKPNIQEKFKLNKFSSVNSVTKVDTRLAGFGLSKEAAQQSLGA